MKRLLIILAVLAFIGVSCRSNKDNNIYVRHAKEKDQFKVNKKYKPMKKCTSWN